MERNPDGSIWLASRQVMLTRAEVNAIVLACSPAGLAAAAASSHLRGHAATPLPDDTVNSMRLPSASFDV